MPQHSYPITLPNGKTYEVLSDNPLTQDEAYRHAQQQAATSWEGDVLQKGKSMLPGFLGGVGSIVGTMAVPEVGVPALVAKYGPTAAAFFRSLLPAFGGAVGGGAGAAVGGGDLSDIESSAVTGAAPAFVGPSMQALGRTGKAIGTAIEGVGGKDGGVVSGLLKRAIPSGLVTGATGSPGAGLAAEMLTTPAVADAITRTGSALEAPAIRNTVQSWIERAMSPSMSSLSEAAAARAPKLRQNLGIRQSTEAAPMQMERGVERPHGWQDFSADPDVIGRGGFAPDRLSPTLAAESSAGTTPRHTLATSEQDALHNVMATTEARMARAKQKQPTFNQKSPQQILNEEAIAARRARTAAGPLTPESSPSMDSLMDLPGFAGLPNEEELAMSLAGRNQTGRW